MSAFSLICILMIHLCSDRGVLTLSGVTDTDVWKSNSGTTGSLIDIYPRRYHVSSPLYNLEVFFDLFSYTFSQSKSTPGGLDHMANISDNDVDYATRSADQLLRDVGLVTMFPIFFLLLVSLIIDPSPAMNGLQYQSPK